MHELSVVLLFLCLFIYYWHLRKIKRQRKLSSFEFFMFIMIQIGYFLWAGSYLLLFLDRNY
ncbi:hypothetical protein CUC15_07265 [Oceanobacillus zhaokaii]|uniref:Uncharacterized protein n=1 Tax=Oceanobacillus zhaokaii TaxID=2052660 RepID=A0A345PM94_9BACI|nr:hypothetical protein CUC15_07265 [Oceanobacillus zhaokaii]